ncbi:MAG: sulfite exporter TauE/SafE family protein [Candidatus Omnitrophica bacterium]|nr:sulfite exporter TauE/SafE family protein [Candidatus Omnitrophota bacterium]MCG2703062.1 sulfite exporter TauE/SafE family protein [Candidatus Omnitrophota bacterium]
MFGHFSLENISALTYLLAFGFGMFICFTPCVYPVMPIIIGYIGSSELKSKKEGFQRSAAYVLGLACAYSVIGAAAALSGSLFGVFQSSFWVNFIVGNVFIVMGLFMLEVFHLPQLAFSRQAASFNTKKFTGAFMAGAVSGLVVGPCTTPVLGGILAYVAAKQNVFLGITLLFTYALGMGFPLLILGTFVGLLKKMPRSGQWMLRIKKIFGLILIAAGEYFLIGMR